MKQTGSLKLKSRFYRAPFLIMEYFLFFSSSVEVLKNIIEIGIWGFIAGLTLHIDSSCNLPPSYKYT